MFSQKLSAIQKNDLESAKILIVDDQQINLDIISNHLAPYFKICFAETGIEAIDTCLQHSPDLIVMDVEMPDMNGLIACKKLKSNPNFSHIPILFSTAITSEENENECWKAGGDDFLTKPINPLTLINRVKSHIQKKLQADILRELIFRDGLTGIYNRSYFDDYCPAQMSLSERSKRPLSILMIDIDFFKKFNDYYGHVEGDECLKQVATTIQSSLRRPTDIVARYGGEEFICVLPDTDKAGASEVADNICRAVFNLNIEHKESPYHYLSVSIGITCRANEDTLDEIVSAADKRLYRAKSTGKNCYA